MRYLTPVTLNGHQCQLHALNFCELCLELLFFKMLLQRLSFDDFVLNADASHGLSVLTEAIPQRSGTW